MLCAGGVEKIKGSELGKINVWTSIYTIKVTTIIGGSENIIE